MKNNLHQIIIISLCIIFCYNYSTAQIITSYSFDNSSKKLYCTDTAGLTAFIVSSINVNFTANSVPNNSKVYFQIASDPYGSPNSNVFDNDCSVITASTSRSKLIGTTNSGSQSSISGSSTFSQSSFTKCGIYKTRILICSSSNVLVDTFSTTGHQITIVRKSITPTTVSCGTPISVCSVTGVAYLLSQASATNNSIVPLTSATYTVTVTKNSESCNFNRAITVGPIPSPNITVTETSGTSNNDGTICNGASVTLNAGIFTTYIWSTGATTQSISPSPTTNTTYTVTVTNSNGCSGSDQQIITVSIPIPSITITETSGTTNIDGITCSGASVILNAGTFTTYIWSTGATTQSISPSPTTNTTYTVTVTNSQTCTASDQQIITVNPLPTPSITISEISGTVNNDGTICNGASVTLNAGAFTSYIWSTTATTQSISPSPTTNTTYTVTVTNSNACTGSNNQSIIV
jgi:hypothetical protein